MKRSRRSVAILLCLGVTTLLGCRSEHMQDGKTPRLIKMTPEEYQQKADDLLFRSAGKLRGQDKKTVKLGKAGFAGQTVIDGFINSCRKLQTGKPTSKKPLTEGYGSIWRGKGKKPSLPVPKRTDEFLWIEGDADFIDPNLVHESAGTALASQMFEPLLNVAPGNGPPRPGQATGYTVSEDGLVYTFKIRKGLVWSDGTALDANDFRYSWLRALDPKTGSQSAQQMWYIKGAKDFNQGRTTDPKSVGIEVPDPHTFRVTLESPAAFFPDLVTYVIYAPVPKHTIEKHGKQWTRPENIVVNGPYLMTEWKPRDRIIYRANPKYWDTQSLKIKRSTVRLSSSETANLNFYKTGQAHVALPLPQDQIRKWLSEDRPDLHIDQQMCTYYYVFRTTKPPFDNPLVRRAFNMAVDKERLTSHVLSSMQQPASHLLADMFQGTIGYRPISGDGFDPEGARALLAQAGYPGGKGLGKIELLYNTYEIHRRIAVFIQRSLKENLGVELVVNNMEWKSLLKRVHAGDFQFARTSWCADYPDPLTFLGVFHSDSESNYAAYKNPVYDALIARIQRERDGKERNALICAAERVLNRDLPISPLYFYTRSYLLRTFVKGYEPQYQDHHLLKYISIEL